MKFLLNKDKSSMLVVGDTVFTFDDPGPKEIDLDAMAPGLVKQLIYNCRRGLLACGSPDELLAHDSKPIPQLVTDHERPIPQRQPIQPIPEDAAEEDLKSLKKMLKSKIPSIRKELATLPPGRVRKLKELEQAGKNRKRLIADIDKILAKHKETTKAAVGSADVGGKIHAPGASTGSPNVSDIVESEVEEVSVTGPGMDTHVARDISEGC